MPRKKNAQDLFVFMNAKLVGKLTRESNGVLTFAYADEWLNWTNTRPISLSMPLTEIPYRGEIVECYFDNLLPDNDLIRKRIQTRFATPSIHSFDLLSQIGTDCVGALQLLKNEKAINIKKIEAAVITNTNIANLLKHYKTAPLGMDATNDFRISIAGAQEKTALLWYQKKWHLPKGVTPTSHIIKLPIGQINHSKIDLSESIENEWLCLKILSAFNLPVNNANIVHFDDMKTLVVERFDRRWSKDSNWLMRLPQEDLCQALAVPSGLKYESDGGPGIQKIMQLLLSSEEARNDRQKFMKSVFLFWVMGGIDGHAKNFSITLEPQGRYRLTPLYDVISAYPLAEKKQIEWHDLKMAMALKSKSKHYQWNSIQIRHWLAMAEQCQFPITDMQSIIDEIFDTMETVIEKVAETLPKDFPTQISQAIFSGMRKIRNKI